MAEKRASDGEDQDSQSTWAVSPLPHVVWRCIASHLSDSLGTLLHLASFSADLREICRPYISAFFETVGSDWIMYPGPPKDLPTAFYFHRVVQLILEGYVDASAIRHFLSVSGYKYSEAMKRLRAGRPRCSFTDPRVVQEQERDWNWQKAQYESGLKAAIDASPSIPADMKDQVRMRFLDGDLDAALAIVLPLRTKRERMSFERLLIDAIEASPFIATNDLKDTVRIRFLVGDPDAALAVLLPLCTKLKVLDVPDCAPLCEAVVHKISQEYEKRGAVADEARQQSWAAALRDRTPGGRHIRPHGDALPFSELVILHAHYDFNESSTFHLSRATPYLGIPSLHLVVIGNTHDATFEWPADATKCHCPEIYFDRSSLTRKAVIAFAEGCAAPCEIRQWFSYKTDFTNNSLARGPDWDTLMIERDEDGVRRVNCTTDFEGYDPGHEHPWASWVCWGKMVDWKRMDEPFALQDGDDRFWQLAS